MLNKRNCFIFIATVTAASLMLNGCQAGKKKKFIDDSVTTTGMLFDTQKALDDKEKFMEANDKTTELIKNIYWAASFFSYSFMTSGWGNYNLSTFGANESLEKSKSKQAKLKTDFKEADKSINRIVESVLESTKNTSGSILKSASQTSRSLTGKVDMFTGKLRDIVQKTGETFSTIDELEEFPGNIEEVPVKKTCSLEDVMEDDFLFRHLPREMVAHSLKEYLEDKSLMAYQLAYDEFPEHPRAPEALYRMGLIHMKRDDCTLAMEKFKILTKKYSQSAYAPDAVFLTGVCMISLREYDAAIEKLYNFIDRYPWNKKVPNAYQKIAESYYLKGMTEKALEELKILYGKKVSDKTRQSILLQMADIKREIGEYESAVKIYKKLMKIAPFGDHFDKAQYMLAITYLKMKDYDAARSQFESVIASYSLNPYIDNASFGIAESFYLEGKYDLASRYFDTYLNKFEKYKHRDAVLFMYGDSLYRIGLFNESINVFEDFLRKYPLSNKRPEAKLRIADIFRDKKDYKDAEKRYMKIAMQYPDSEWAGQAMFQKGECFYKSSEWKKAIRAYKEYIDRSKFRTHVQQAMIKTGICYSNIGEMDNALKVLENARLILKKDQKKELYEINRTSADIYFSEGKYVSAYKMYKEATEIGDAGVENLAWSRYRYAECLMKLGQNSKAIEAFRNMAALYPGSVLAIQADWNARNLEWKNNYGQMAETQEQKALGLASNSDRQ